MSALSNVHATSLLNTSLRSGTYYLALFLTDPTASGNGTEVSGGGYARKIITFGTPSLVSGKEQVTNSAAVDFGTMTATSARSRIGAPTMHSQAAICFGTARFRAARMC